MKAWVVDGSKQGGTERLAHMVGQALTEQGIEVAVRSAAGRARDVATYDVVVVGGTRYASRWHKDARWFVRREAQALRATKVWLFSSGAIGDNAPPASELKPVSHVRRAMDRIGPSPTRRSEAA
jgi:menaquinone-dependent protoporphyrinogen oxidase